jgi:S1-C subfamily serine protease
MLNLEELHSRIVYPVVRVRGPKGGGSGTLIYSKADPGKEEYINIVMTACHVIEDAIQTKKEWDSLLKKTIEKEFLEKVGVEIFDYVFLSTVNSSNSYKADIMAYDKHHDIALLKLESPKKAEYVAQLLPKDKIKDLKLFREVYASGASLLHDPIFTKGQVTYFNEMIENEPYLMASALSIFGNSGGAVFLSDTGEQIGISARITSIQLGFGVDIIPWMGFAVPIERIYKFLDDQELKFLYDPSDTYEASMKRREKKQKRAKLEILKEVEEEEKKNNSENEDKDSFVIPTPSI